MSDILSYLRSFRHLIHLPDGDGELLQRFRVKRDELAFATLVQRHGPMVLGIAQRILGQRGLLDDVFQATFLVLAKRGRQMETWPSVAGWLVQVARRTALQARAKSARRTRLEQQAAAMTPTSVTAEPGKVVSQSDLSRLLDTELARLPSKYRTPLVLCYLEGQTKEETARQLGWPVGSVSGRLARGKKLLQDRLLRRGIVPAVASSIFTIPAANAHLPSLLIQSTTLLAINVVHQTSKVPTGIAIVLAQGVMTSMLMTKVKYAASILLVLGLCLCTGAWAISGKGENPGNQDHSTTDGEKIQRSSDQVPRRYTDYERLEGIWRKEERNPVTKDLIDVEELIFRGQNYVRRSYSNGFGGMNFMDGIPQLQLESPPGQFELHELQSPKGIDFDIRDEAYFRKHQPLLFDNLEKLVKQPLIARRLGIYELKETEFRYVIGGQIPMMLEGNRLVPDLKNASAQRVNSFENTNSSVQVYRRVSTSYKDDAFKKGTSRPGTTPDSVVSQVPSNSKKEEVPPRLLDLRQQRLQFAQERLKLWQIGEASGSPKATIEELGNISHQVLDASLALSKNRADTLRIWDEHLKMLKQIEEKVGVQIKSGTRNTDDLLTAQLRRIEVEIKIEERKELEKTMDAINKQMKEKR